MMKGIYIFLLLSRNENYHPVEWSLKIFVVNTLWSEVEVEVVMAVAVAMTVADADSRMQSCTHNSSERVDSIRGWLWSY